MDGVPHHVVDRVLPPVLVLLHAGLFLWASVGLVEWLVPGVAWRPVSNALFPRWLLLLHWLAVLNAAAIFLAGYVRRWPRTPVLLVPAYAFMAGVCTVETVFYLTHPLRYVAMALELAAYVLIPLALCRVPGLARRFGLNRAIERQSA